MLFTLNKPLVRNIPHKLNHRRVGFKTGRTAILSSHSHAAVSGIKVIWSQSLLVCPRRWQCGQYCSASSLMTSGNSRGTDTGWRNTVTGTSKSNNARRKGPEGRGDINLSIRDSGEVLLVY